MTWDPVRPALNDLVRRPACVRTVRGNEVAYGEASRQLSWPKPCPLCGLRNETPGEWGGLAWMARCSSVASWNVRSKGAGKVIAQLRVEGRSSPVVGGMAPEVLSS